MEIGCMIVIGTSTRLRWNKKSNKYINIVLDCDKAILEVWERYV